MNLVPSNTPPASTELAELVDRYLDQRLDEAAGRRFEELLNEDPQARAYCAERIRLHAELGAQARPLRIEIFEGRQLVIEQTGETSTVEVRSTGQVTVAPATGALALAGPSAGKNRGKAKFLWAAAGIGAAALLSAAIWIAVRSRPAPAGNTGPGLLALRPLENASFETPELSDGETTTTPAGWKLDIPHFAVVINPATDPANNRYGGPHLPRSENKIDGANVLSLRRPDHATDPAGRGHGWAKQRLQGRTGAGFKVVQLGDLDGGTIRVTMLVARPALDSGQWADDDVHLLAGIQEDSPPWRMAAVCRIDTGSDSWKEADLHLGLGNDEITTVSFDLKVEPGEMRGDAWLFFDVDLSTPPGAEIYLDRIRVEWLASP
jgi:hypothetical protein